jgi:hypothetical protein
MVRKLGSFFSGKFFKASDFPAPRLLTIEAVAEEEVGHGRERKLVVRFKGESQSLVLNRTNGDTITEIARTDDLDSWSGTRVVLYATTTDFSGRRVDCIRVREPKDSAATGKPPTNARESNPAAQHQLQTNPTEDDEESADDCPF